MAGWVNIDHQARPGVDVACDLDSDPLPFDDDSVDDSLGSHVLEHLHNPLHFMGELWRVTKPGGTATFHLPYGTSDDAWEDPTHVRPYFVQSSIFFGQPAYWRADYGYTADWSTERVELDVPADRFEGQSFAQIMGAVLSLRNVVRQMSYHFVAVKPARPRVRDDSLPNIEINLVES